MKRFIPFLIVLAFILGLSGFKPTVSAAWDSGCYSNNIYSITTGQPCNGGYQTNSNYTNYIAGCTGTNNIYSTVTGQLCSGAYYGGTGATYTRNLSRGSRGEDVRAVQQALKSRGFLYGNADGVFGRMTEIAVLNFQSQNNMDATGIVDYVTFSSLGISNSNNNCPVTYQNGIPQYLCTNTNPISINSVSGPQSLGSGVQGTWTVNTSSYTNGYLSYSVDWGDQPYNIYSNSYAAPVSQQSATFTHTYYTAGTYNPRFTITNSVGQTASTSLSVIVGTGNYYGTPLISYLTPSSGGAGTQVTIYGSNFSTNSNTVIFGAQSIPSLTSYNGTSLSFTVPTLPQIYCFAYPCNQSINVSVTNSSGMNSNVLTFNYNSSTISRTPTITYISPSSGAKGATVTIYGSGFVASNCANSACTNTLVPPLTINFGSNVIKNIFTSNDNSVTFTVPSYTSPACFYSTPQCYIPPTAITPGVYPVTIETSAGVSNSVNFTVTY
jgi:peptidoglycan hydrolase-like protein with peptidoglycan-binding domain